MHFFEKKERKKLATALCNIRCEQNNEIGIFYFFQYLQYKNYVILIRQHYLCSFVSYSSILVFYYTC
jgi:hypothetical protein